VLAVLAMACFPGLAQAEEATGPQYTPEVPTVPNNESSNPPKNGGGDSNGDAGTSGSPDGAGVAGKNDSGSGDGGNKGQGSQASGKNGAGQNAGAGGAGGDLEGSKPLTNFDPAASQTSDDGSSPLVPILIAIAVLAAISIGAFYYRQRRQGPDSPVSPKAS
jgi:hypothetical protein